MMIKKGFLAIDSVYHAPKDRYIVTAFLLDNICTSTIPTMDLEMQGWDGRKIVACRVTVPGPNGTHLKDKYIHFMDDVLYEHPLDYFTKLTAGNAEHLFVNCDLSQKGFPVLLTPNPFSEVKKLTISMEISVNQISSLADYIADSTRRKEKCITPEYGEESFRFNMERGSKVCLSKDFWHPVEWSKNDYGVLKITDVSNKQVTGTLYVCSHHELPEKGTLLYRESGWEFRGKSGSNRTDLGRISSVSHI